VIPVEQLDRGREGPLADPADGERAVGHEVDPLGLVHAELGAQRGEPLGEGGPALGPRVERPADERPPGAADLAGAVEDQPDLDLQLTACPVVDHRPIGADPDGAAAPGPRSPVGVGAEYGLGVDPGRLESGSLGSHPAVELAPADRPPAQLGRSLDRLLILIR